MLIVDTPFYEIFQMRQINEYVTYHYLKEAKQYYPNFDIWYYQNVIPAVKNGDKKIITIENKNTLKGICIVKLSEKKLCTLRVMENYRNKGIGIRLFEKSFEALNTRMPLLSVSEEKLLSFKKIFDYYGFKLTSIKENYYRKGKKEYFYNEPERVT
ncbi:GNAT family N-acetyltransferase [Helicobacter sp. UBA3407]|uniref:GNAT family N-acetyltransferase n=1 Tax=Helicobacter TaxID=209 RepID=UPI0026275788|nr:GNAT family N-acetyltransferase [Helicobacter sp. UBA3407]